MITDLTRWFVLMLVELFYTGEPAARQILQDHFLKQAVIFAKGMVGCGKDSVVKQHPAWYTRRKMSIVRKEQHAAMEFAVSV